ncbi:MAG: TetR/AcrR family transcriptional regulator [Ilumatobacteraceae bacterium]
MNEKLSVTARTPSRPTGSAEDRDGRARKKLVAAAKVVFERDGFHDARIVDIAASAKVGVGTFYRHFESKVALFCAVIAQTFDEIYIGGATRAVDPDNPALQIELANRRFFRQYRSAAKLHSLLEQLAPVDPQCREIYLKGRDRAVERIARSIVSLQEDGRANPNIDARQAARLLVSMTNNYAHMCFSLGEEFDEEASVSVLSRLWADGIGLHPPVTPTTRRH